MVPVFRSHGATEPGEEPLSLNFVRKRSRCSPIAIKGEAVGVGLGAWPGTKSVPRLTRFGNVHIVSLGDGRSKAWLLARFLVLVAHRSGGDELRERPREVRPAETRCRQSKPGEPIMDRSGQWRSRARLRDRRWGGEKETLDSLT